MGAMPSFLKSSWAFLHCYDLWGDSKQPSQWLPSTPPAAWNAAPFCHLDLWMPIWLSQPLTVPSVGTASRLGNWQAWGHTLLLGIEGKHYSAVYWSGFFLLMTLTTLYTLLEFCLSSDLVKYISFQRRREHLISWVTVRNSLLPFNFFETDIRTVTSYFLPLQDTCRIFFTNSTPSHSNSSLTSLSWNSDVSFITKICFLKSTIQKFNSKSSIISDQTANRARHILHNG